MTASDPTRTDAPLLVFGDDGSPGADVAWLWVNNQPWPGWQVDAVTAAEPELPPADWSTTGELREWSPPWGRTAFDRAGLESVTFRTATGDARVLLGDRTDADLMVVGSRGLGHLQALWVGSTAEWLMHHPPAPLVVVHSAARVSDVTVCVDGSDHAQAALEAFLRLPLAGRARVTVLSAYDGWAETAAGTAKAMAALEEAGVEAEPIEVRGKATHVILHHLDERRPQLVVLGTRGLTGLQRLRLGSTASAVVRAGHSTALLASAQLTP